MNETTRKEIINTSWEVHHIVEESYLSHPSSKGDDDWLEKQRILLADMAIHLLQTAIKPGNIELDKLKNNLHAILMISDQFLPEAELKKATNKLYMETSINSAC
ncbi:hypothetical protein [Aliikangiella sp. G2MR2-5]|uniref:hypothetical protein n=1 Tax=Aliikangiella sp. G2MR2-5 TaxID=2788943 RepID=UPI0018AC3124|nr:hypothetical protein [Aliikangiella sp. G2MR2-5]